MRSLHRFQEQSEQKNRRDISTDIDMSRRSFLKIVGSVIVGISGSGCNLMNDLMNDRYRCSAYSFQDEEFQGVEINRFVPSRGPHSLVIINDPTRAMELRKDQDGWNFRMNDVMVIDYSFNVITINPQCDRKIILNYRFELAKHQSVFNRLEDMLLYPNRYIGQSIRNIDIVDHLNLNLYYTMILRDNSGLSRMTGPENAKIKSYNIKLLIENYLKLIEEELSLTSYHSIIPTSIRIKNRSLVEDVVVDNINTTDRKIILSFRNSKTVDEITRITGQPYNRAFLPTAVSPPAIPTIAAEYFWVLTHY